MLYPAIAFSQETPFFTKIFTTDQGLANNHVCNILQEKSGALWLGTFDGISRFDGYDFENYYSDPKDTNSLGAAQVSAMTLDRCDNLWVMSRGFFLYKLNRKNRVFELYNQKITDDTLAWDDHLITDPEGNLWLLALHSFIRYFPETGKSEKILFADSTTILKYAEGLMTFDQYGDLWILKEQLYRFREVRGTDGQKKLRWISTYDLRTPYDIPNVRYNNYLWFSIHHAGVRTWLSSNFGLYCLEPGRNEFVKHDQAVSPADFSGHPAVMWSDINGGLHVCDPVRNETMYVQTGSFLIESAYRDRQGTIWIGSMAVLSHDGQGLLMVMPTGKVFRNVTLINKEEKNRKCAVSSIGKDSLGNTWIATRDYNYPLLAASGGRITKGFLIPPEIHREGATPKSIFFDDHDRVWIGYLVKYLIRHELKTGRTSHFRLDGPAGSAFPYITSFRKLQRGEGNTLWAGVAKGFCRFSIDDLSLQYLNSDFETRDAVSMHIDEPRQEYWIGLHGKYRYYKEGKFIRRGEICQSRYDITSFLPVNDSVIWISLYGGGIVRLNKNTWNYEQFTMIDGLSNNSVYQIFTDSKGNLWMSTNKGISRYNPVSKQFWNFGLADGVFVEEFNGNAAFQGADGEIIFGGMGGIVSFYPDSVDLQSDTSSHFLLFDNFRVSGIKQHFDSAVPEKSIFLLQQGQDNFSVTFACIDLKNSEKIKYRYCLPGYHDDWTVTGSRHRYLSFANLQPGTYRCVVEATDIRGNWSNRKEITVVIPPTFFQRMEVRTAGALLGVLILALLLRMTVVLQRRKVERREEALRQEGNYRSQMNPHFISNILTTISSFIGRREESRAGSYLTGVRDMIRRFLLNSEKELILLQDELDLIQLYIDVENQNRDEKIRLTFGFEEPADPLAVKIPPAMIQPLAENAVMHGFRNLAGRPPELNIHFRMQGEQVCRCTVSDNGTGLAAPEEQKSLSVKSHRPVSMENIRNRLKIQSYLRNHPFELKIEPGNPHGVVATMTIPANTNL